MAVKAWYFSTEDKTLRYCDGRKIRKGATHRVTCEPVLCQQGLHASGRLIDALGYAPGPVIWRVELSGTVVRGDDKMVATARTYVTGFDASEILRTFARWCALQVADKWDMPDVVRRYLETGDESLKAEAESAAYSARSAAYSADSAAYSAAYSAARDRQNKQLTAMIRKALPPVKK
jgi:hypothetical protein